MPPAAGSLKPCAQPSTVTRSRAVPSRVAVHSGAADSASRSTRPSGPAGRVVAMSRGPDGTTTGTVPGAVIRARVAGVPSTCQSAAPPS